MEDATSAPGRPIGSITRGTTHPNRLRRVDRWLLYRHARLLREAPAPAVMVDLGYGASPVTTVEWRERLRAARPDLLVVGIEIDPARVAAAAALADPPGLTFRRGGFETPLSPATSRALVIRAFNVLRQYDQAQVPLAWAQLTGRLAPGGRVIDGTCDEIGRLATWLVLRSSEAADHGARSALSPAVPESLVLSWRLRDLQRPSTIAERLPKWLIHRNVPGEPIHRLLVDLDQEWDRHAGLAPFGPRQRFQAAAAALPERGWPVLSPPSRTRLGELEVPWHALADGRSVDP